jgi:hypothetical protein
MLLRPLPADERCVVAPPPCMPATYACRCVALPRRRRLGSPCSPGPACSGYIPAPALPRRVYAASALLHRYTTLLPHTCAPPPAFCPRATLTPLARPCSCLLRAPLPHFFSSLQFYFETIFPRVPKPGAALLLLMFACLHCARPWSALPRLRLWPGPLAAACCTARQRLGRQPDQHSFA